MMKFNKIFFLPLLTGFAIALSSLSLMVDNNSIAVLSESEMHDVFIGDVIKVDARRLEYQGEYKDVQGTIYNPNGDSYQGKSFAVNQIGLYKVVYQAFFNHHKEEQTINYLCKRKSENFFTITNPVGISYGEYRHNTINYHHEGVLIDVKNGTEITFNEPLSIDDFMVEQNITPGKGYKDRSVGATAHSLINFLVDPSTYMSTDFNAMTIRLTDSIDKANYVDIRIEDGYHTSDERSGTMSYVRVGASCNWQLGWEWDESNPNKNNQGKFHNGIGGSGLNLSYRGQPYNDNIASAQILYCASNSRFYNYLGSLETEHTYFINDLSDPIVYGNNVWNGFASGKFYLSIIPTSFSNATGRLLIKSVGKYLLSSEVLTDDIAPIISVDTLSYDIKNLPRAVIGRRYPIYNATVFDNYDSNLEPDISVTYRDTTNKKDIDVPIVDHSFLTNKSGVYTIKYSAKDKSGNISDVTSLKIITVDTFDDVILSLNTTETTVFAYDNVLIYSISEVNKSGGIGNIEITRKIIGPNDQELTIEGNRFRPSMVGDYQVIYQGKDYVGNTGEVTYTIHTQALSAPRFIEEPNLPKALIKGFKYTFDSIRAIETKDGHVVDVVSSILINGAEYTGEYIATEADVNITYRAKGVNSTTDLDVPLQVVDVSNGEGGFDHSKFFVGDYDTVESVYNDTPNVTLSGNNEGYTTFINDLNPDSFYLGLHLIREKTNMNIVSIRLVDSLDKNNHVTFDINIKSGTIYAPFLPELPFTIYEDKLSLDYNDSTKVFLDTNQNVLGTIIKNDNGNAFEGFKSGLYLEIGFKEVTDESSIAIEKICNQPIGYRSKGKDRIQPSIRYHSSIKSEQRKGEQFVYPTFEAFDVISDIKEVSITITKPDNSTLVGDNNMSESFIIDKVGEYRLTYYTKDSSDNIRRVIEIISVYDDVKPTISVNNPPNSSYKMNSAFTIPTYTVSDDGGKYTIDVFLILPTNEMRILTHHVHDESAEVVDVIEYALDADKQIYDSSFIIDKNTCRLQMKGTYRLRFVAYDEAYNTTSIEYGFTVK